MDYLSLKAAVLEASALLVRARVGDVSTPSDRDALLRLGRDRLLLLSASAERPGIYLPPAGTSFKTVPLPFTELLRSRLAGSVVSSVDLPWPGERIARLTFAVGWPRRSDRPVHLFLEVMGRHSNLILTDAEGLILGSVKSVPASVSRARPVLAGTPWQPPPERPGIAIELAVDLPEDLSFEGGQDGLLAAVRGLSPWTARQAIRHREESPVPDTRAALGKLLGAADGRRGYLSQAQNRLHLSPFQPILDQGSAAESMEPFSAAAWAWRTRTPEALPEETPGDPVLAAGLELMLNRVSVSLGRLDEEELRCQDHGTTRSQAEALLLNLAAAPRGTSSVRLPSLAGENLPPIPLDPSLSPQENANRLFDLARRMKRGLEEVLARRKALSDRRETILAASAALSKGDPLPARELLSTGAPRKVSRRGSRPLPGRRHTIQGFDVLVGKSARDNERVTFEAAGPSDLWLHTRDYPGSHVVILAGKRPVPEEIVRLAAQLAVQNSGARRDTAPEVMVTERKWVRKLKGGKPGQVTVERFRTVRVRTGNNSR